MNFYPLPQRILALIAGFALAALGIFAASPQSTPASNPMEAARVNNLGVAYMNQQLFEKALKEFQDASHLDSALVFTQLNQGVALLALGRVDDAKKVLEEAAKRDPKNPRIWYNLGILYKNLSNSEAAIDAFRRVTVIDSDDANTWYFLGAAYAQNKQFPEAMDAFQNALKLEPRHASAEFGLSRAYQQSGDTVHAREHLVRFQYITKNKIGAPMGLAYGDQGKYSLAEESPMAVQKVPPQIPVKFVDVTKEAGIVSRPDEDQPLGMWPVTGTGACFLDFDDDGTLDLFLSNNGPQGGMGLYRNLGTGEFEDVTRKAGLDPALHAVGCATGDYDNDGFADLAFTTEGRVVLMHNEKKGTFKDVTESAGIKNDGVDVLARSLTFIDYDHDGDLDLYVTELVTKLHKDTAHNANQRQFGIGKMWRNNGNGAFTDVSDERGSSGQFIVLGAVGSDYNNDRAVDLIATRVRRSPIVFENPREGKFLVREPFSFASPEQSPVGLAVLDFDHDGWMDLAFTHANGSVTLWRNSQGKSFEQVKLPDTNWARALGIAAFDYDNDGWVDLVAAGETKEGKGEIRLFRNLGPDGWKDVTADVGLDKISLKDPRAIITGDYDNDGATDLLITQNLGPAILLKNEGGNKNNWLRLALKGLNDNKSAIGTKVEIFSDGIRQKYEIYGSNGYLGQNSPYLTVGLGQAKQADIVRMLWPSGVLQDEIEVAGNREQTYTEIDRRGSSCPTLFAWNGKKYELVGDMLGAGVVGHWVGPGQRDIPRPSEYIKVNRNSVREKDGRLSFRFMEPLEEVVYLDQVKLLAVDHPAGLNVYPNEYFASNPPFPPFKVVFSRNAQPPAGAWDEHGHNVLPDLLAHRYFGDFDLLPFHGFAKLHSLELDLGEPYNGGPLWLLMHGEVEYFTATSMFAAYQAHVEGISPYVEAQDANGKWARVVDDMGFPAGGPRTMTADLTGKLPVGTRRIRISTNLQIYWNEILINHTEQDQPSRLTAIPLARADLRFHGFPLKVENTPPGNVEYIYEKASATGPYTRPAGTYTRYGNVLPLLTSFDDQLAVFGSGDEVALDFDPSRLPSLPTGWVRDYFFAANGYEKDMDFYAYEANQVEPLPFRSMGTYPYPGKTFPLDDAHMNYMLNYNTRHVSGNEQRGYSFDYK